MLTTVERFVTLHRSVNAKALQHLIASARARIDYQINYVEKLTCVLPPTHTYTHVSPPSLSVCAFAQTLPRDTANTYTNTINDTNTNTQSDSTAATVNAQQLRVLLLLLQR